MHTQVLTLHITSRNTCRVTVVLLPDSSLGAKVEGEEKAKLEAKMKSMSPKDVSG